MGPNPGPFPVKDQGRVGRFSFLSQAVLDHFFYKSELAHLVVERRICLGYPLVMHSSAALGNKHRHRLEVVHSGP